jgi:hypothetical protein
MRSRAARLPGSLLLLHAACCCASSNKWTCRRQWQGYGPRRVEQPPSFDDASAAAGWWRPCAASRSMVTACCGTSLVVARRAARLFRLQPAQRPGASTPRPRSPFSAAMSLPAGGAASRASWRSCWLGRTSWTGVHGCPSWCRLSMRYLAAMYRPGSGAQPARDPSHPKTL